MVHGQLKSRKNISTCDLEIELTIVIGLIRSEKHCAAGNFRSDLMFIWFIKKRKTLFQNLRKHSNLGIDILKFQTWIINFVTFHENRFAIWFERVFKMHGDFQRREIKISALTLKLTANFDFADASVFELDLCNWLFVSIGVAVNWWLSKLQLIFVKANRL